MSKTNTTTIAEIEEALGEHDALLAACKRIWHVWHTVPYDNEEMNKAIRAMPAIAKAGGRAQ